MGATGFVGRVLVRKAIARGDRVRALVRTPGNLGDFEGRVEVVQGDMSDATCLQALTQNVDALVSTAGPPRQGRHDPGPYRDAMTALVRAMHHGKVERLVTIAGAAARLPGEILGFKRSLLRAVLKVVMPDVIRTKDIELEIVSQSGLRWTVIRPPRIGKGNATGKVTATDRDLAGVKIDVEDITDFILSVLQSNDWVGRAPTVASSRGRS